MRIVAGSGRDTISTESLAVAISFVSGGLADVIYRGEREALPTVALTHAKRALKALVTVSLPWSFVVGTETYFIAEGE